MNEREVPKNYEGCDINDHDDLEEDNVEVKPLICSKICKRKRRNI